MIWWRTCTGRKLAPKIPRNLQELTRIVATNVSPLRSSSSVGQDSWTSRRLIGWSLVTNHTLSCPVSSLLYSSDECWSRSRMWRIWPTLWILLLHKSTDQISLDMNRLKKLTCRWKLISAGPSGKIIETLATGSKYAMNSKCPPSKLNK